MTVVVSDTSPIRALHHLRLLDLLPELFGTVVIPSAVARELQSPKSGLRPIPLSELPQLQIATPENRAKVAELYQVLDAGESEAIALAIELNAAGLLIDEENGRAVARHAGLKVIGVIGVLILAKQIGRVSQVRPLVEQLRSEINFFVSKPLMRLAMERAQEPFE